MLKMVAFDLDQTIGDTIPFGVRAFKEGIAPYAGGEVDDQKIMKAFGLNELGIIKSLFDNNQQEALESYHKLYEQYHYECEQPFEGIVECINFLLNKGVKVALITGKGEIPAMITLNRFGITHLFCDIHTGRDDRHNKVEPMLELMQKYAVQKSEFIYVGDAVSDVKASDEVGVKCLSACWCDRRYIEELEKINKGNVLHTVKELRRYFEEELKGM